MSEGKVKEYSACRGSWRPDFLIEERAEYQDGEAIENFMITEINARFSFNGAFYVSYGQDVLDDMALEHLNLSSATTSATVSDIAILPPPLLHVHSV